MVTSLHTTSRRHRRALAVILAALFLSSEGRGQEPLYIGVSGGYEFGLPLGFNRQPGAINRYGFDGAGSSEDRAWRIGAVADFPTLINDDLGLVFRGTYLRAAGSYLSNTFYGDPVFDPGNSTLIIPSYRLSLESNTSMLEMSVSTSHRIAGGWTIGGGVWGSYRTSGEFTKVLHRQFENGNELELEREEGEQLGAARMRLGLQAGTGVRIPLFSRMHLQPELFSRFDAMALGDVDLLQALSIGGGISLLFDIGSSRDTAAPPPLADAPQADTSAAPVDSLSRRTPRLEARIDLFSIDETGERSQISAARPVALHRRQQMPFPATIFFDRGSAGIPSRYVRLDPAGAAAFSVNDLARLDPLPLYRQALNLLGLRLRGNAGEKVRLVGTHGRGEAGTLGRLRAEGVRAYLRDIWGIDESRMAVRDAASPDRAGGVRVEGSEGLLAPVVTEWRRQTYVPLDIDLEPVIEAEAGVRFWSVTVRQGERVITSYSSRPEDSLSGSEIALHIPEESGENLPPLVAELVVEDSTGGRRMAADTLPLVRQVPVGTGGSPERGKGERRAELLYLAPWNNGDSWGDTRSRNEWIAELAEAMTPGSRTTVSPAAGAATASSRLGQPCAACSDIASRLKSRTGLEVTTGISPSPLSDAASPEERMIGSLVRIEIRRGDDDASAGRP